MTRTGTNSRNATFPSRLPVGEMCPGPEGECLTFVEETGEVFHLAEIAASWTRGPRKAKTLMLPGSEDAIMIQTMIEDWLSFPSHALAL
jgi:hypothetical protein